MAGRRHISFAVCTAVVGSLIVAAPTAQATTRTPSVSKLHATATRSSVTLSWRNPRHGFNRVVVRYRFGVIPPTSPYAGHAVPLSSHRASRVTLSHLAAGSTYAFTVWTHKAGTRDFSARSSVYRRTKYPAAHAPAIQGTIRDAHGKPLGGIALHAVAQYGPPYGGTAVRTRTAADGSYTVSAFPPGQRVIVYYDNDSSGPVGGYQPNSVTVQVLQHRVTTGASMNLRRGGQLTGRITDTAGKPLPYVDVQSSYEQEAGVFSAGPDVRTNASGRFRVTGLSPGYNMELRAVPSARTDQLAPAGYQSDDTESPRVHTGTNTSVHVVLKRAAAFTGRVTDSDGNPLAGVLVGPGASASARHADNAITNADGRYRVGGYAGSSGKTCFLAAGITSSTAPLGYLPVCKTVTTKTGKLTRGVDVMFSAQGAAIGGTVTGPNGPVKGVRPVVFVERQYDGSDDWSVLQKIPGTLTDDQGHYLVGGLGPIESAPNSQYVICFDARNADVAANDGGLDSQCDNDVAWNPDGWPGYEPPQSSAAIVLTPGQTTTADADLSANGAVIGTVRAPDGSPVPRVLTDGTVTDANGNYRVTDLSPGASTLCFDPENAPLGAAGTGFQYEWPCPQQVNVIAGQTVTKDITLPYAGAISGLITARRNGAGLAGVELQACSSGGCVDGRTDANGRYFLPGVGPSDDVSLSFSGPYLGDDGANSFVLPNISGISVSAKKTTTVNAAVRLSG